MSVILNGKAGSALMCRAHLLNTIFNFTTSIRISFLHLGQYSGNFTRTVSSYTFVLVFPPQSDNEPIKILFDSQPYSTSKKHSSAFGRLAFAYLLNVLKILKKTAGRNKSTRRKPERVCKCFCGLFLIYCVYHYSQTTK